MKNRKIHPSPTPTFAVSVNGDAIAVLSLLPATILALTAVLTFEDKEVVAYLMICSINGSDDRRRCRIIAGAHRPLFDCGCFDCYTSFWSRWDSSSDRETIHLVIESFEEHLATKEKKGKGRGKESKRRRKKKLEKAEAAEAVVVEAETVAEESKGLSEEAVSVSDGGCIAADEERESEDEELVVVEMPAVSGAEKRRGWADVMGILNLRLWSLWSPGM